MAKKDKIYIGFVLDETGSMLVVKDQTISGFNEYLNTLKDGDEAANVRFTLTKFNSLQTQVVYDNAKLEDVAALTHETYNPNALTPLYDAVGATVRAMESKAKKSCKVLVVIQTDGEENDSKEFTRQAIFDLISARKSDGWTFVFLGADQDAWAASGVMGIDRGCTMSYASAQTQGAFAKAARCTSAYVASASLQTSKFFDVGSDVGDDVGDDGNSDDA